MRLRSKLQGVLPSGNVVAVKQLYVKTAQGHDEFLNEVVLITGMKHRNLVNLKGCCLRESQRLLVYEYVDNLDVEQLLLGGFFQSLIYPPPIVFSFISVRRFYMLFVNRSKKGGDERSAK